MTERAERVTSRVAWALTKRNLSITRNAGRSWHPITPPQVPVKRIMAVLFTDSHRGYLATSTDAPALHAPVDFYRTTDGGRSWQRSRNVPRQSTLSNVDFAAHGARVWALTGEQGTMGSNSGGHLYLSDDRGASWKPLPATPLAAGSIEFTSANEGWLEGGVGRQSLWQTRDGGRSWRQVALEPPRGYRHAFSRSYYLPQIYPDGAGLVPAIFARPRGHSVVGLYVRARPDTRWRPARTFPLRARRNSANFGAFAAVGPRAILVKEPVSKSVTIVTARPATAGAPRLSLTRSTDPYVYGALSFADRRHGLAIGASEYCPLNQNCSRRNDVLFSDDGGRSWHPSSSRP